MVTPINNSPATSAALTGLRLPAQRHAFAELRHAVRTGDLDAAKQVYSTVAANLPTDSWNPNGPFAQLGKALEAGDVEAAQTALAEIHNRRSSDRDAPPPEPAEPPVTPPAASSTGGLAGGLVSTTA